MSKKKTHTHQNTFVILVFIENGKGKKQYKNSCRNFTSKIPNDKSTKLENVFDMSLV